MYHIKEMFFTLQGEGARTGRCAVFCRFSGCNLWSGHERDRHRAICRFCDTDFVGTDGPGGGVFSHAEDVARRAADLWRGIPPARPYVVCTGGEPLLQLDRPLIDAFHDYGFEVAIETNGTLPAPSGIDWICVSPKAHTQIVQREGNEMKLVWPQKSMNLAGLERWSFNHFFLQPMDGKERLVNMAWVRALCLQRNPWNLSLQAHKIWNMA